MHDFSNMKNINFWNLSSIIILIIVLQLLADWPAELLKNVGNAFWISIILMGILTLFIYLCIIFIRNKKNANEIDFFTICERIGGKLLKNIIVFIYFVLFYIIIINRIRQFSQLLKIFSYPTTPFFVISFLLLATIAFSLIMGFDKILKVSGYFIFLLFIVTFIFLAISLNSFETINYTPILGNSIGSVLTSSYSMINIFTPMFFILFFPIKSSKYKKCKKYIINTMLISILLILSTVFGIYNSLAEHSIYETTFPLYAALAQSDVNINFDGFEILITFCLYLVTLPYLSFVTQIVCNTANILAKKMDFNVLSLIILATIYLFSILPNSIINSSILSIASHYSSLTAGFIIPILIFIIFIFKKEKNKSKVYTIVKEECNT